MSKTIIIIGQGQVGRSLADALRDYDVHIWPSDIDDLTEAHLDRLNPHAIINAAGRTDLSWCEEHAREAMRSNVEAPVRLYDRIVNRENTRFIHFSSGCVWDGPYNAQGKPFEPNDPPTPACLYSWSKAACDALLLDRDPERVAVLRARQVYSDSSRPRNTLIKLSKYPALIDTPNSMTSIRSIEKMVRYALEADSDWGGIWNVYDRGTITPYEIGGMLAKAGLREAPAKITKSQLDEFHKPKRVDTVLHDARFEREVDPPMLHDEISRAIEVIAGVYANAD